MSATKHTTDNGAPYQVPPEPNRWPSIGLAVGVHALLLAFLWIGVSWQNNTPVTIEAEVWDVNTQTAAPPPPPPAPEPEPEPEPQPDTPPPPPPPPAPAPRVVEQPAPPKQPDIALEREKKRKEELKRQQQAEEERQERLERERELAEQKRADEKKAKALAEKKERELAEKKEREKERELAEKKEREAAEKKELAKKEEAEKKKAEKEKTEKLAKEKTAKDKAAKEKAAKAAETAQLAKLQDMEVKRLTGNGNPGSTGTAAKSTAPRLDSGYLGAIAAKIKSNANYAGSTDVAGNPMVSFVVEQLPTGEIVSVRKTKSSGIPEFDDAVERSINKSSPLPKKKDGTVERSLPVNFRMKDLN